MMLTVNRLLIVVLIIDIKGKFTFKPPKLIGEWLRLISPYQGAIVWPFNPLDEALRQAIEQIKWDGSIDVKPEAT